MKFFSHIVANLQKVTKKNYEKWKNNEIDIAKSFIFD